MTWRITTRAIELCSCKMLCPCWLGPEGVPDEGWCSGAFAFDVQQGDADGVNLSGSQVVLLAEWPGNFFGGNGTARLYISDGANAEQRRELEAIFSGKKGGPLEPLFGAVVAKWLPAQFTNVDIQWGDTPTISVGKVGQAKMAPLKDQAGHTANVRGAAAMGAFQSETMDLASSKGSRWSDPDLRAWEGDSGTIHTLNWSS